MAEEPRFGNYLGAGIICFIISYVLIWFLIPYVPVGQGYSGTLYLSIKALFILLGVYAMTYILSKHITKNTLKHAVKAAVIPALLYGLIDSYLFVQKEIAICEEAIVPSLPVGGISSCGQFMIHPTYALMSFIYFFIIAVIGVYLFYYIRKVTAKE